MTVTDMAPGSTAGASSSTQIVMDRSGFDGLLSALQGAGYEVIGPRARNGSIIYDEVQETSDLPIGLTEVQEAGTYRLEQRGDEALFGFASSPESWKKYLFPPRETLWKATREDGSLTIQEPDSPPRKLAFIGVRSCDLHAIAIQDHIFIGGPYVDSTYEARRRNICLIAVNCGQAGGTCFCTSMGTGPKAQCGFDLALTEVIEDGRHYFVVDVGSDLGMHLISEIRYSAATEAESHAANNVSETTAAHMGRTMAADGLQQLLRRNYQTPQWDEIASRCLSCGNCTLVCPTCFCSAVEDTTDLTGDVAERTRRWDSCFTSAHSYIHGGSVRPSPTSRYRQWMTHKLGTWWDQFGMSGCTGCGRCITWCPVGIDLTAEVAVMRASESEHESEEEGSHGFA